MSNEEINLICNLVKYHMQFHSLLEHKDKLDRMKILRLPFFDKLVIICRADDIGSHNVVPNDRGLTDNILENEEIKQLLKEEIPKPILTGNDLIKYGRQPSPLFKKMLDVAHHIQVNQGITDKHMLYKMVKNVELNKDGK